MSKRFEKVYVVDTNVGLSEVKFYDSLEKNSLIIFPYTVIEELDKFKTDRGQLGVNARALNRFINSIAVKFKNSQDNIVQIDDRFYSIQTLEEDFVCKGLNLSINDDRIISTAIQFKLNNIEEDVCMLSNDTVVRSKTLALYNLCKVDSKEFDMDMNNNVLDFYKQFEYEVSGETMSKLYTKDSKLEKNKIDKDLTPNTSVILINEDQRVLCRVTSDGKYICTIDTNEIYKNKMVKPLNDGQCLLASMILDENIKIKAILGRSGSGKSLISMAYALKMLDDGKVSKIKIIKPVSYIGEQIGFLPNGYSEKCAPIKESLYPIFEILGRNLDQMEELGLIEFDIPLYQRGMTYRNTFLIITEAQNLDSEIKALLTRIDDTSMAIVEGDSKQTDMRYLSEKNNGLTKLIDRLDGQEFFGKIYLNKSERSKYLDIVDELL